MLFDLRGRRKRFIQVIYVFLALLLGGSLVFFGIGGDAPGGLGDAIGLGEGNTGGNVEFNQEIEAAEATLLNDPENAQALLALARYSYLDGQQSLEIDAEGGQQLLTDEAISDFETSVDAWERYLDAKKGPADPDVATLVFRAYSSIALNSTNPAVIQRRLEGAQRAAAAVVEERAGPTTYLELAAAAYFAGDTKAGEEAGEEALKSVDDQTSRNALERQLEQAKRQGRQIQRQLNSRSVDEEALQDPFGNLGADPSATPAP